MTHRADAALSAVVEEQVSARLEAISPHRAFIEQAKGMLIFVYGVDADGAFEMLRWQSQQHNVKLHLIAEQIVKDLAELSANQNLNQRMASDRVLLTAHQRISHVAARQLNGESKTDA